MNIVIQKFISDVLEEAAEKDGMNLNAYVEKILINHYAELITTSNRNINPESRLNAMLENVVANNNLAGAQVKKIGSYVRSVVSSLVDENKISEDELNNLINKQYSKDNLHLNYPMFLAFNRMTNELRSRYYKRRTYVLYGAEYYLCNDWYEQPNNNDRPAFEAWVKKIKSKV